MTLLLWGRTLFIISIMMMMLSTLSSGYIIHSIRCTWAMYYPLQLAVGP